MSELKSEMKSNQSKKSQQAAKIRTMYSKGEIDFFDAEHGLILEKFESLSAEETAALLEDDDGFEAFCRAEAAKAKLPDNLRSVESEKVILNAIFNEVRLPKPTPQKIWSALQHYIYFIYRHVISSKPLNNKEVFPSVVTRKIRDLVDSLLQEDVTQLYIRIVALLREYATISKGHYENFVFTKATSYLIMLLAYYSSFCTAANKLAPLLPEFECLIMERFSVNWVCLNKGIFYYYVYLSPAVQDKLPLFQKLKEINDPAHEVILESYASFCEDMSLLASRWTYLKSRIYNASVKKAMSNPQKQLIADWKTFLQQKLILSTTYWLVRSSHKLQLQDMSELDAHILSLVGDTAYVPEMMIDSQGRCLCEDCLAAELKHSTMTANMSGFQSHSLPVCRLISCYICQEPVPLEIFSSHVMVRHFEVSFQKTARLYLTPHQKKLSSKKLSKAAEKEFAKIRESLSFEGLFERNAELKESILKIVNSRSTKHNATTNDSAKDTKDNTCNAEASQQPSITQIFKECSNQDILDALELQQKLKKDPTLRHSISFFQNFPYNGQTSHSKTTSDNCSSMQNGNNETKDSQNATEDIKPCKAALEEFLRKHSDANDQKLSMFHDHFVRKTSEITIKKSSEASKKNGKSNKDEPAKKNGADNSAASFESSSFRKPQQKATKVDPKVWEFLKNSNSGKSGQPIKVAEGTCLGHACGHKCKPDDMEAELKKFSQDPCELFKESRKCECAYCEVFGVSLSAHAHKTNETRDRLRTRLNQRKGKANEDIKKEPSKNTTPSSKSNAKSTECNGTVNTDSNSKAATATSVKGTSTSTTNDASTPVTPVTSAPVSATEESKIPTSNSKTSTSSQKNSCDPPVPDSFDIRKDLSHILQRSSSAYSISSSFCENLEDDRDINELLNYIEGNKTDKANVAKKKAAKKARQKVKKAQHREYIETERKRKEEARLLEEKRKEAKLLEEKRKEAERLEAAALAKQAAEKKKIKNNQDVKKLLEKQETKKTIKKKNKGNNENSLRKEEMPSNSIEETIPAMVTIKRVKEGDNVPATVTITLKGSTPESDKLLLTLVNGDNNNKDQVGTTMLNADAKVIKSSESVIKSNVQSTPIKVENNTKALKKKQKGSNENVDKELKVTIAVDKNNASKNENVTKKTLKSNEPIQHKVIKNNIVIDKMPKPETQNNNKGDVNLPLLRLPPGITITKIEAPAINKNVKSFGNSTQNHQKPNVPVSKSGVIVVDTEKLIQQSITANNDKKNKKRNKKEQKKAKQVNNSVKPSSNTISSPHMVTLKNPAFNTLQNNHVPNTLENSNVHMYPNSQQASIFKNDNGMVTIRSPRLHSSYENGTSISNYLTELKPMFGPEMSSCYVPMCNSNTSDSSKKSNLNAQEILSGLPGIEITKVDKTGSNDGTEVLNNSDSTDVSIIPTKNNIDKFYFDKDDWTFESVFDPRDEPDDDMDAEERELEAFKRFCQQSVPPEHKRKVTHLNVKDIVLTKRNYN